MSQESATTFLSLCGLAYSGRKTRADAASRSLLGRPQRDGYESVTTSMVYHGVMRHGTPSSLTLRRAASSRRLGRDGIQYPHQPKSYYNKDMGSVLTLVNWLKQLKKRAAAGHDDLGTVHA